MHTLQIWISAMRPKTLPAGLSPVILGTFLAYSQGFFDPLLFVLTLLTALGIQISTNFANDYFDCIKGADTSQRKGPTRLTQAGLVLPSHMKIIILLSISLTALIGLYLSLFTSPIIAILVALSLFLAVVYTGGPYPLAYLGLGDLFVFTFFGPIATAGTYWIQTRKHSWESIEIGFALGALSTAILCVNNLRDVEEDRIANKKTLVVRFGTAFGKAEYLFCLAYAAFLPFLFFSTYPLTMLSLIFLIPAFSCIKKVFSYQDPKELNSVLAKTGKLLLLYTILFSIGWLLSSWFEKLGRLTWLRGM
jgi:1,4-dihydroxy-2-naphthoate polyprenyltransferase